MPARSTGLLVALLSAGAPATAGTCTWQGGTGTWYTAASWSCGAVPTPDDDVIGSGTLTMDVPAHVRDPTLTSGMVDGPNDLTVDHTLVWEAGTMAGTGTTTVTVSTLFRVATSKNIARRVVLHDATTWSDGTLLMRDGGPSSSPRGRRSPTTPSGPTPSRGSARSRPSPSCATRAPGSSSPPGRTRTSTSSTRGSSPSLAAGTT